MGDKGKKDKDKKVKQTNIKKDKKKDAKKKKSFLLLNVSLGTGKCAGVR